MLLSLHKYVPVSTALAVNATEPPHCVGGLVGFIVGTIGACKTSIVTIFETPTQPLAPVTVTK